MVNLKEVNKLLKQYSPIERIRWVYEHLSQELVATTSGGRTSRILPSLIQEALGTSVPTIFVDTGHYPVETHAFVNTMEKDGVDVRRYTSSMNPQEMELQYGRLWEENGTAFEQFLQIAKHEPLNKAFKELGAQVWIRGIMGFQTDERARTPILEYKKGLYRLHPVIDWKYEDAQVYLEKHSLPMNSAHYDITKGPNGGLECRIGEKGGIMD